MRPIKIGFVQINNSFSGQGYLPYSVGLLEAYAKKHLRNVDQFEFLTPIYSRQPTEHAVTHLKDADIVVFSAYVWNTQASLQIAAQLKMAREDVLIVFGGPQVPNQAQDFLTAHPYVDLVCHGEGEAIFLDVLRHYQDRDWNKVHSVSFLKDGSFVQTEKRQRIKNLDSIPSPYLNGAFDNLMQSQPDEQWIVLLETNRGCPFSCAFCDWGSAVQNQVYPFGLDRIFEEIEWISKNKIEFVYCCDANFGLLPRDIEIVERFAANKKRTGYPKAFSVQNTKNSTEKSFKIQNILAQAGLNKGVTLSLQSMHFPTLKSVGRENISVDVFEQLQQKFTRAGIETYTDVILGLPDETYETFSRGVSSIIEKGQHNRIQFNNLSLLPNAQMNSPDFHKRYALLIRDTKIINVHGSLDQGFQNQVDEKQQLVVGTSSMPGDDWIKARSFSWMSAFLYFDKVLQIPLILLMNLFEMSFKEIIEAFLNPGPCYPTLSHISAFFASKAKEIQDGGSEYCESREWLGIWWPADELVLIELSTQGKLGSFYKESMRLLEYLLGELQRHDFAIIREALEFNEALLKQPFVESDLDLKLSFNIWEAYQRLLMGKDADLADGEFSYRILRKDMRWGSWQEWCREVIWWGNKKGAYLYPCQPIGKI